MRFVVTPAILCVVAAACSPTDGPLTCHTDGPSSTVPAAAACAMLAGYPYGLDGTSDGGAGGTPIGGTACAAQCPGYQYCEVDEGFVRAFEAGNADAGVATDGGATWCPPSDGVLVTCHNYCLGRRTLGASPPPVHAQRDIGATLAERAQLEAVSVFAFERLERELAHHGAPPSMRREARRAKRDEVRHTSLQVRLARRRGAPFVAPARPNALPTRTLVEVALENAVEGCARETYGAAIGLVEARTSSDLAVRRAMRSIAPDECRHAELAWAVHAWALPRLSPDERTRVLCALRGAIAELVRADRRLARPLFEALARAPGCGLS